MRHRSHAALLFLCTGILGMARGQEPLLQLQGEPYFDGDMTLHVTAPADVGELVWLGVGLDPLPLDAPVQTGKGPWYIGNLLTSFVIGAIPVTGRLDLAFTMPPATPGVEGTVLALQAYVAPVLSNPASLGLDAPYFLPANAVAIDHPVPSVGANFGDTVAAGDFNADGVMDLAVGAWFEDIGGFDKAGRVYLMWGPDYAAFTVLESPSPKFLGVFGGGLGVADVDGDGVDDLVIGEACGGDPPTPGAQGFLHVFQGGVIKATPWLSVPSLGTALEAQIFGRVLAVGDVDGNGAIDFGVGTPDATVAGFTKAGRLEVFHGPGYGPGTAIENPEPKVNDFFGSRLKVGDVTGDGIPDLVEASGRATVGTISQAGRLHAYDGPTLALLATIDNPEPAQNDRFGEGLFVADLDGDGLAEAITADVKDNFYVVWDVVAGGPIANWPKPPSPNPTGGATSFGYFFSVADANEDARPDMVIADPFEGDATGCSPLSPGGSIYTSLAPYFSTFLRFISPTTSCGDEFSWRLISVDLDGDGRKEIPAGSRTADIGGLSNAGRVVIVKP
jgi:hypothetical protein